MMTLLQAQGGGGMSMLIMMALIFVIMWLFMIRPQQKKQKEIQKFRNSIAKGQAVVTAGGIYGVVRDIDEVSNTLQVEIANGVRIKIDRNSVYADASDSAAAPVK